MKKQLSFILSTSFFTVLILLSLELFVRQFFPEINHQDTQFSLYKENAFGDSVGWKPNAVGESFGQIVFIDDVGFRKMMSPKNYKSSWIILGDSVAFGVGVETKETFAQLLQDQLVDVKIWNTSVVGYSIGNYRDVLYSLLHQRNDIEKVILFYCLNDIYNNLYFKPHYSKYTDKVRSFLKRKSKLYMLLKHTFFDRSKAYALHDISLYTDNNKKLRQSLGILQEMSERLRNYDIDFSVVILPYEYQLRENTIKNLVPQDILLSAFSNYKINVLNAYEYFVSRNVDFEKFYLYDDAMHLSPYGHKVIFELIQNKLTQEVNSK